MYALDMIASNNNKDHITYFGETNYRNVKKRFGIKEKDRSAHMYVIGKTGTGKSTLIENMVISDIEAGNGLALIDPHGDLAEEILHYIPEKRINDVIYFNPSDLEHPIAFNPLEKVDPSQHHLVASGLISVFKKIWQDFWGPRLEHIMRHSILALLDYPGSRLLDMSKLLTDKTFRDHILQHTTNPQVKDFWRNEFEKYSSVFRSEAASPILNKIGQFLTSTPVRNIVSQRENTFDLRKVMDEGKILLLNLSKGRIGEDNCSLLGALMVTKILLAAFSRAEVPEQERRPFYLYTDEFHNFFTISFADILSEARKYALNLILAHQYTEQLDEKMWAAVFGNVGTLVSFRVGAEDAKYLAREFYPVFGESDLVNLPSHQIYLRLMIDGVTSRAFSATTLLPPKRKISLKKMIVELSRKQYGRARKEVEKEMIFKGNPGLREEIRQARMFS